MRRRAAGILSAILLCLALFLPSVAAGEVFADEAAGKPVLRLHRLFCIGLWLALAGMLGMLVILGLGVGA